MIDLNIPEPTARQIMHNYRLALTQPRTMARWNDVFTTMQKYDFQYRNPFLTLQDTITGVIHQIPDINWNHLDARSEIKAGKYHDLGRQQLTSDPFPLTMDQVIPFVIPNWSIKGILGVDIRKIASPATAPIQDLFSLTHSNELYEWVKDEVVAHPNDFKNLGNYLMGYIRLYNNSPMYLYWESANEYVGVGTWDIFNVDLQPYNSYSILTDIQHDFIPPKDGSGSMAPLPVPGSIEALNRFVYHYYPDIGRSVNVYTKGMVDPRIEMYNPINVDEIMAGIDYQADEIPEIPQTSSWPAHCLTRSAKDTIESLARPIDPNNPIG